jgi:hypothetical protein
MTVPWNVELKFDRAAKHVEELRAECAAFLATEPHSYTRTVEGGTREDAGPVHVFRWERFEKPPRELGLVAGDAVHNARSALDHLAVHIDARGAALAGKKEYTEEDERKVQFPITSSRSEFDRRAKRDLPCAHPDAIKVVEAFQPYNVSTKPDLAQILILSELDNLDKHRTLAPIGFSIAYAVGRWPEAVFPAFEFAKFADPNATADYGEPGSEILRFSFPDEYAVDQIPCQLGYEVALFAVPGLRGLDAKIEQVITTVRSYAVQIADRTLP